MKRTTILIFALALVGFLLVGTGSAVAITADSAHPLAEERYQVGDNTTTTVNDSTEDNDSDVNETTTEIDDDTNESADGPETEVGNETVDPSETNETDEANETDEISPGARLSGVIGVQGAELDGEVSQRAFGLSVAAAVSNGSKARVVADRTDHLENRLEELRNESEALEAARDNDTISNATYQARAATLSARINSLEQMVNQTIDESERIPPGIRMAHGVNETRLAALHQAAGNATGQEVAAIARSIAGPNPGHHAGMRGPPAHAGPNRGNTTNGTIGPPENVTQGPPANVTTGPPTNMTQGPPENVTQGPPDNRSRGPSNDSTMGPSDNHTRGPPNDREKGGSGSTQGNQGGPPTNSAGPP